MRLYPPSAGQGSGHLYVPGPDLGLEMEGNPLVATMAGRSGLSGTARGGGTRMGGDRLRAP